jgi:hypothetical protein
MPNLVIRREPGWERKPTTYTIFVDGEQASTIAQGQQVLVAVAPGRHRVVFRLGRYASDPIDLSIVEGKDELLECSHEHKAVPALLGKLFAPKSFIRGRRRGTGFAETKPAKKPGTH